MPNDSNVYAICQNKIFLNFNEWLDAHGFDFRYMPEDQINIHISAYTDFIQAQLIDLMEQYRNAD